MKKGCLVPRSFAMIADSSGLEALVLSVILCCICSAIPLGGIELFQLVLADHRGDQMMTSETFE